MRIHKSLMVGCSTNAEQKRRCVIWVSSSQLCNEPADENGRALLQERIPSIICGIISDFIASDGVYVFWMRRPTDKQFVAWKRHASVAQSVSAFGC
uniref:Uncharacterized protein n=1 Tax=Steinernema glaseri TaxID=37863 RepID=A0A1I8A7C4_9BILA